MKRSFICLLCTAVLLFGMCFAASASEAPPPFVNDKASLLSEAEELALADEAQSAAQAIGCAVHIVTCRAPSVEERYIGEDFIRDYGLSYRDDLILLVITLKGSTYYYHLYLYGAAEKHITEEEVDLILDAPDVRTLKSGRIAFGASSFLRETSAYYGNQENRINPYLLALPIALVLALIFAAIVCAGVVSSYRAKKKSVDYPLNQFAKLELTDQSDVFVGSFVTTRILESKGSSGGMGGSRGGGMGGGRGHAGGR